MLNSYAAAAAALYATQSPAAVTRAPSSLMHSADGAAAMVSGDRQTYHSSIHYLRPFIHQMTLQFAKISPKE